MPWKLGVPWGTSWGGGQCAFSPLDVAVLCKIQWTHSLTGPGNGVGSLSGRRPLQLPLGTQRGQVTGLRSHSQEVAEPAWSPFTGWCQRRGEQRGRSWVPTKPSLAGRVQLLCLWRLPWVPPVSPLAHVPCRPCPLDCLGQDTW